MAGCVWEGMFERECVSVCESVYDRLCVAGGVFGWVCGRVFVAGFV